MRTWQGNLTMLLILVVAGFPAKAEDVPRLQSVEPVELGEIIQCRIVATGLPGEKQLQTMRSGLESAVEFHLALLDRHDRPVARHNLTLRMGFDLWEEIFSVRTVDQAKHFENLDGLRAYLEEILGGVPVAPAQTLQPGQMYRLQADLVVHSLAPDEQKRVEDVIVGEHRTRREGQDQQEASVSLGRLMRLFYKGDRSRDGQSLFSAWFTRKDLEP